MIDKESDQILFDTQNDFLKIRQIVISPKGRKVVRESPVEDDFCGIVTTAVFGRKDEKQSRVASTEKKGCLF